jgi:hypothetical protein
VLSLTWPGALAWRMRRHLLDPIGSTSTAGVVGALGAVAAQLDPAAAELGVRTRRRSSRPGDVGRALDEGSIIKTFAFRGATHLMTPDQAGVHLALRAASRMWERPSWQRYYELTPADWPALRAAVREALTDEPMTRAELGAAVAAHPRFRHLAPAFTDPSATLLKPLAWHGDLSLGPLRDGQVTLQRLDGNPRWAGLPDIDEAGRRAIEAYLRAYGPASADNLQYWLGEGLGVRRALIRQWSARLGGRLCTVEVDAEPRLVLREDLDDLATTATTTAVRLLTKYDQWVLGPGTADVHVVPAAVRSDVSRGANVVVVGGVVAGTWSLAGDAVVTSWSADAEVPANDDLDREVARLAEIVGRPLYRVAVGAT